MNSVEVRTCPPPPIPGDVRLRVNNVMRRLSVSDSDVRHLARHGRLKGFKVGKLWFFWLSDVLEYQSRTRAKAN